MSAVMSPPPPPVSRGNHSHTSQRRIQVTTDFMGEYDAPVFVLKSGGCLSHGSFLSEFVWLKSMAFTGNVRGGSVVPVMAIAQREVSRPTPGVSHVTLTSQE